MPRIRIAIDGPAASGKSTTAKRVAESLRYIHIDTGAMYRAVTLYCLDCGISPEDRDKIVKAAKNCKIRFEDQSGRQHVFLNGADVTERIRSKEVTSAVSAVSAIADVRALMVREQRRLSAEGGVVLDGRDIGTVVLPDAELKIFMLADSRTRAGRRLAELKAQGLEGDLDETLRDIERRDNYDSSRAVSPLAKAEDAIVVDTTMLSIDEQVHVILSHAERLIGRGE